MKKVWIIEMGNCHFEIIPSQIIHLSRAAPGARIDIAVNDIRGKEEVENLISHFNMDISPRKSNYVINIYKEFASLVNDIGTSNADAIILNGLGQIPLVELIAATCLEKAVRLAAIVHGAGCIRVYNKITEIFAAGHAIDMLSCFFLDDYAMTQLGRLHAGGTHAYCIKPFLGINITQLARQEPLQSKTFKPKIAFVGNIDNRHGYAVANDMEELIAHNRVALGVCGTTTKSAMASSQLRPLLRKGLIESCTLHCSTDRMNAETFYGILNWANALIKHIDDINSVDNLKTSGLVAISRGHCMPLLTREGYLEPFPAIRYKSIGDLCNMLASEEIASAMAHIKRSLKAEFKEALQASVLAYERWLGDSNEDSIFLV